MWEGIKNCIFSLLGYSVIILSLVAGFFLILHLIIKFFTAYGMMDVAAGSPAAALLITAIIAFLTLRQHRRSSEEAYVVLFRELHKEFWNDEEVKKARRWICCNDAYSELLPALEKTLDGESESAEQYNMLESLDRFCAIMLRIAYAADMYKTKKQKEAWRDLGFYYWYTRIRQENRLHIIKYINFHWEELVKKYETLEYLKDSDESETGVLPLSEENAIPEPGL